MKIKITADRIIDLPKAELDRLGIATISCYINMNEKSYEDMIDITLEQVFDNMRETGKLAKTAAKSPDAYYEFFAPFAASYDTVIHFAAASGTSAICSHAIEASKRFKNVYVFDTKTLSCGIALLAKYAIELIQNGETNPEVILAKCGEQRKKLQFSFMIDTLECLHKGGRCSVLKYGVAKLLKLRPVVTIDGDTAMMKVRQKCKGNLKKCLTEYITSTFKQFPNPESKEICILYTSKNDEMLQHVVDTVKSLYIFENVYVALAGCNAGVHSGPNTFGLCYFMKI